MRLLNSTAAVLAFVLVQSLSAQTAFVIQDMKSQIPPDPKVKIGKLDNGMVYYIKENKKPEKRAELMIAVNAGAIDEDDDQNGLAHFCEHMAFNGTKHFPKQQLVDFLESVGVSFGPDLNAFTSEDRTVYMLTVPTDKTELMDKGLLVLGDWAHNVLYEDGEIDKERGVILEEWRLGKGADDRIDRKQRPVIYYNSKYALRDVIGDTSIINRSPYDAFRRFYRDWYRPGLMAIIAVGDFDKNEMEKKIREQFGKLKNPETLRSKEEYGVPWHKDVKVTIATDKELSMPTVEIIMKHGDRERRTYESYKNSLVLRLAFSILNQRLAEIRRKPDAPFNQFAYGREGRFAGKSRAFFLSAASKGDKINESVLTLLREAFRVKQQGFTPTELERAKSIVLKGYESSFNERDKTRSKVYAFQCVSNYLQKEPMPGEEVELGMAKKFLPEITLDEVNNSIKKMIIDDNTVIAVRAPERADVKLPTENELLAMLEKVKSENLAPYIDNALNRPLLDKELTPLPFKKETTVKELGVTELILNNGVKVILKPTDFQNDRISFSAFSPGGTSLCRDEDFQSAKYADDVVSQSGLGAFDNTQLVKYLSGKVVYVSPSITELSEGVNGSSSVNDAETMMQMIYLTFTQPRADQQAFDAFIEKTRNMLKDSRNDPEGNFYDSVDAVSSLYHPRRLPVTEKDLEKIDRAKVIEIYKDRFADASDFTFIFVGNFGVEKFKPLVAKYLGNLPAIDRKENWKDIDVKHPQGKVVKNYYEGIEHKSTVWMTISNKCEWDPHNNLIVRALMDILDIRLREVLREEKGGVYGVGAWEQIDKYPKTEFSVSIYFGCNPDRVEELTGDVMKQLDTLRSTLADEKYMVKAKEILTRAYEVNLKENNYWLGRLQSSYYYNTDPKLILENKKWIDALTPEDIKKAANIFLNTDNLLKCVLYPEKGK